MPLLWAQAAEAHSFGTLYTLPVPFSMYVWGAAGALLFSFAVIGWIAARQPADFDLRIRDVSDSIVVQGLRRLRAPRLSRVASVGGLVLCIATGLFGTANPYLNLNMTLFWILFVLGFTYLVAAAGDLYSVANPWRVIVESVRSKRWGFFDGRVRYPPWLDCWPALAFYMGFIWVELFAFGGPYSLAVILLGYTAINVAGAWLVGSRDWFLCCEFFGVFLRLIGRMSPVEYLLPESRGEHGRVRLRLPFGGLLQDRARSLGEVTFILFMLSSTAFDGLHVTQVWGRLYWVDVWHALQPWLSANIVEAYPTLKPLKLAYDTVALIASPFVYLAAYLVCSSLAKALTQSQRSSRELGLCFAYSLVPITLVYNVTHYYTLILTQGVQIVRLASDPFGVGWNLFGTAGWMLRPALPAMGAIWHTQVGLIVLGHIMSVHLAHLEALRVFPDRRTAMVSQLPMLLLMVLITTVGLWILAQPIQSGQ